MLNILTFSFTLLFLKLLMVLVDNSVVNLASSFVGVEPIWELERRWGKTFHVLKLFNNTTKAREVSAWRTCCYHWIEYRARQRLVPKDILASHWYGKDQCLDPIPSSLSSEWKTTERSKIFASIKSWATRCSNPRQQRKSI